MVLEMKEVICPGSILRERKRESQPTQKQPIPNTNRPPAAYSGADDLRLTGATKKLKMRWTTRHLSERELSYEPKLQEVTQAGAVSSTDI